MQKWLYVTLFVAGAALTWGIYVPLIHTATQLLKSNLRAFFCVGIAYFLVAVIVPSIFIFYLGDPTIAKSSQPNFGVKSVAWGLIAGIAGAAGALCVIFASKAAGPWGPIIVAPLVFGWAPIVNTLATIYYFHPVKTLPDWKFFAGIVLAAVGAVMVMVFKPADEAKAATAPAAATATAEAGATAH